MNCADELKLLRMVRDKSEMERLREAVGYFGLHFGGESRRVKGSVDNVRLCEILEAFEVLVSEKLESAL